MLRAIDSFLATLQRLGPLDDIVGRLPNAAPVERPLVNAHLHLPPNFSAFDTTGQAVDLAAGEGVAVLGASNYYDYSVYGDFARLSMAHGIFPLFGIEIIALIDDLVQAGIKLNDPGNPGKMYLCGKGISRFDPMTDTAADLLQVIRDNDSTRMAEVVDRLETVFEAAGWTAGLNAAAATARIVARHGVRPETVYLQERHAAQAFQERLFEDRQVIDRQALLEKAFGALLKSSPTDAVAIQSEIRSQLMKAGKPAYSPETFVDFDHAYRLILALGGVPSYPLLIDGASPICGYEASPGDLITDLTARGIHAVEFIPLRNSSNVLSKYAHAMRAAGFVVTATQTVRQTLVPIAPTASKSERRARYLLGRRLRCHRPSISVHARPARLRRQRRPPESVLRIGKRAHRRLSPTRRVDFCSLSGLTYPPWPLVLPLPPNGAE